MSETMVLTSETTSRRTSEAVPYDGASDSPGALDANIKSGFDRVAKITDLA